MLARALELLSLLCDRRSADELRGDAHRHSRPPRNRRRRRTGRRRRRGAPPDYAKLKSLLYELANSSPRRSAAQCEKGGEARRHSEAVRQGLPGDLPYTSCAASCHLALIAQRAGAVPSAGPQLRGVRGASAGGAGTEAGTRHHRTCRAGGAAGQVLIQERHAAVRPGPPVVVGARPEDRRPRGRRRPLSHMMSFGGGGGSGDGEKFSFTCRSARKSRSTAARRRCRPRQPRRRRRRILGGLTRAGGIAKKRCAVWLLEASVALLRGRPELGVQLIYAKVGVRQRQGGRRPHAARLPPPLRHRCRARLGTDATARRLPLARRDSVADGVRSPPPSARPTARRRLSATASATLAVTTRRAASTRATVRRRYRTRSRRAVRARVQAGVDRRQGMRRGGAAAVRPMATSMWPIMHLSEARRGRTSRRDPAAPTRT